MSVLITSVSPGDWCSAGCSGLELAGGRSAAQSETGAQLERRQRCWGHWGQGERTAELPPSSVCWCLHAVLCLVDEVKKEGQRLSKGQHVLQQCEQVLYVRVCLSEVPCKLGRTSQGLENTNENYKIAEISKKQQQFLCHAPKSSSVNVTECINCVSRAMTL